ncbi:hypothetical protein ACFL3G_13040 [Planctomycetota bacterium]
METSDYYCPATITGTIGYTMGRAVGAVRVVTVDSVNPVTAGAVVGLVWGGAAALLNARKYRKGWMTKRDAVIDTAGETAGMGLASAIGLIASNAARASTVFATASALVPFTVGVLVTAGSKVAWDCSVRKRFKCEEKPVTVV